VAITLTRADFIAAYPEFKSVSTGSFESHRSRALLELPEGIWGDDKGAAALKLLVAHQLAMSPGGEDARIKVEGEWTSTYYLEFKRIRNTLGPFQMLV
jgi:hypothetical protein